MSIVRVDLRDLPPGEQLRAPFDERIPVQVDDGIRETHTRGEIVVDRAGSDVHVHGRVGTQIPLTCSRCLREIQQQVRTQLDEEFSLRPVPAYGSGELRAEDFVNWVGPEQTLDITEVVRQQLQLAVPMAPLCRPDCQGLCPVCGANRNERTCEHAP